MPRIRARSSIRQLARSSARSLAAACALIAASAPSLAAGPASPTQQAPQVTVRARVIDVMAMSDGVVVILNRGSDSGIAADWKGVLVVDGRPMPNGDFVPIRIAPRTCAAKVKVAFDAVRGAEAILTSP